MAAHSNAIVVLDNTGMEMINRVPERHGVSAEAAEAGIKMLEDFLKSMDRVRRKVAPAAAKKPAAKKPAAKEGEILLPSSDCPGWQRSRIGKNYYITAPLCLGGQRFDRQSKLESFLLESGIEENISLREPRVSAALKTTATPAFGGFGLSTATSASTGSTAAPTLNFGAAATSTTAAKYQGWRGVQGNFRGKVEVRLQLGWLQRNGQVPGMEGSTGQFQRKGGRKSAAEGEQEGRGAGCSSNYRSQKKTKKRWKGILKEEVAKLESRRLV